MNVKELIEELKQYPEDAEVGYYAMNSHLRMHGRTDNKIIGVETAFWCGVKPVVALVGDFS